MDEIVNEMELYHARNTPPRVPDGPGSRHLLYPAVRCASMSAVAVVHGLRTVLIRANGRLSYVSGWSDRLRRGWHYPWPGASRACRQLRRTAHNG